MENVKSELRAHKEILRERMSVIGDSAAGIRGLGCHGLNVISSEHTRHESREKITFGDQEQKCAMTASC